jgi:hypothetical protein
MSDAPALVAPHAAWQAAKVALQDASRAYNDALIETAPFKVGDQFKLRDRPDLWVYDDRFLADTLLTVEKVEAFDGRVAAECSRFTKAGYRAKHAVFVHVRNRR